MTINIANLSDAEVERQATITGLSRGDFGALYPILESLGGLRGEELSFVVTSWIKNDMPANTKLYSEALTFGDFERIKATDAYLAAQNKER